MCQINDAILNYVWATRLFLHLIVYFYFVYFFQLLLQTLWGSWNRIIENCYRYYYYNYYCYQSIDLFILMRRFS